MTVVTRACTKPGEQAGSLKKNYISTQGNLNISNPLIKSFKRLFTRIEAIYLLFVSETWLNCNISNTEILPYGWYSY